MKQMKLFRTVRGVPRANGPFLFAALALFLMVVVSDSHAQRDWRARDYERGNWIDHLFDDDSGYRGFDYLEDPVSYFGMDRRYAEREAARYRDDYGYDNDRDDRSSGGRDRDPYLYPYDNDRYNPAGQRPAPYSSDTVDRREGQRERDSRYETEDEDRSDDRYNRYADDRGREQIRGVVSGFTALFGSYGSPEGVHFTFQTDDGRIRTVRIGDRRDERGLPAVQVGQSVIVGGRYAPYNDTYIFEAAEIRSQYSRAAIPDENYDRVVQGRLEAIERVNLENGEILSAQARIRRDDGTSISVLLGSAEEDPGAGRDTVLLYSRLTLFGTLRDFDGFDIFEADEVEVGSTFSDRSTRDLTVPPVTSSGDSYDADRYDSSDRTSESSAWKTSPSWNSSSSPSSPSSQGPERKPEVYRNR